MVISCRFRKEEDIDIVTVTDADSNEPTISDTGYWPCAYYSYDALTTPATTSGLVKVSGVYGTLDDLTAGNYQVEILMADGQLVSKQIEYPGKLELPVIDSSTMLSRWSNGDLILSWTNPSSHLSAPVRKYGDVPRLSSPPERKA